MKAFDSNGYYYFLWMLKHIVVVVVLLYLKMFIVTSLKTSQNSTCST